MANNRHSLAEYMVRRKYQKQGIALPNKFWNLPKYQKDYQHQIRLAVKLLKIYDYELIMLTVKENAWMYSLGVTTINDLIEEVKDKLETQKIQQEKPKPVIDQKTINFRKKERSNFKDGKEKN